MEVDLSLGDFVKKLVASLHQQNVQMPFEDEIYWHELFYELKRATKVEGKPTFFNQLRFDWDGRYPKCQELSDFLHALHWNASISAQNPRFDRISLTRGIVDIWSSRDQLDSGSLGFLEEAVRMAKEKFSRQTYR
jgi:hypothetical protein